MKEKQIRQLLNEFDYNKNTLSNTLEFLLMMCFYIQQNLNGDENERKVEF